MQIGFIVLATFWILTVGLIVGSNVVVRQEGVNQILQSIQDVMGEPNTKVITEIDDKLHILNVTANYFQAREIKQIEKISQETTTEEVKDLHNKLNELVDKHQFRKVGVALLDGTTYLNTGDITNIYDREYFQKSAEGENFVSYLVKSKIDSGEVNVYSVPIVRDNKVIAVLWASISTEKLYNSFELNFIKGISEVFLIDSKGNLVVGASTQDSNFYDFIQSDQDYKKNKKSLQHMKQDIKQLKDGYEEFTYNQQNIYMYHTKIAYNDWWMLTKIPTNIITQKTEKIIRTINVGSLLLLICTSASFYLFYKKTYKLYKQLKELAYTDDITKGKNDIYLKKYLTQYINQGQKLAFLSLEITNIKSIINIIGFKNIYFILQDTYESVAKLLNDKELIVHSYLGEYKILLEYEDTEQLYKKIESIFTYIKNKNLELKMGVYLIENNHVEYEDIYAYVNIAKTNIPDGEKFAIYTTEMYQQELKKNDLENDIKNGIRNKEFQAWFQPKYGVDGTTVVGAEALVRWYKYGTIIAPYIFIPVAEASGLIKEIDELVLEDVCKNLRQWMEEKKKIVPISVNLSRSYLDTQGLVERLEEILSKYYIPKEYIQFEITESALFGNEEVLKEMIDTLHKRGFKVLLDDFGVGYSSIKTIVDMKFDVLKIDKSFIDGIGEKRWEDIIGYTISLAERLQMKVVAEGIETKEQYDFLVKNHCKVFQGYYFNKPMNVKDFTSLL